MCHYTSSLLSSSMQRHRWLQGEILSCLLIVSCLSSFPLLFFYELKFWARKGGCQERILRSAFSLSLFLSFSLFFLSLSVSLEQLYQDEGKRKKCHFHFLRFFPQHSLRRPPPSPLFSFSSINTVREEVVDEDGDDDGGRTSSSSTAAVCFVLLSLPVPLKNNMQFDYHRHVHIRHRYSSFLLFLFLLLLALLLSLAPLNSFQPFLDHSRHLLHLVVHTIRQLLDPCGIHLHQPGILISIHLSRRHHHNNNKHSPIPIPIPITLFIHNNSTRHTT